MKRPKNSFRKLFIGVLAYVFYHLYRILPIDIASYFGSIMGTVIGPRLRANNTARYNLKRAFPDWDDAKINSTLLEMWNNLGRIVAEFPHIPKLTGKKFWERVEVTGIEHLEVLKVIGKGGIVFSGHIGNWEIAPKTAYELGMPLALVYRPANNPFVERLYRKSRKNSHNGLFAKGRESARNILRTLKEGGYVGLLVDQKMNDGIPIPFFGREAMTASAMADIALKMGSPLVGARVIRTKGAYFKVEIVPALDTTNKNNVAIMTEVNQQFENWIREYPAQWLWLHRRWPREPDQPR
ncbi:MAG: lauroyl acyltransferase [Proteobacteria bacterium]|nr:lauroyl acyltransferase [Pseudomonadota bacterium]